MKEINRIAIRKLIRCCCLSALFLISACGVLELTSQEEGGAAVSQAGSNQRWLKDGSITIVRNMPSVTSAQPPTVLGLLPDTLDGDIWLDIDTGNSLVSLKEGAETLHSTKVEGIEDLTPGTYQLVHKQRRAPWYAPKSYFSRRKLPIPPEGDKSRFLRGALGDFALFIDQATPIHSGPVPSDDIGGIKLNEDDIARLYYKLEIGSAIKIR
jgi:hypothetical protein